MSLGMRLREIRRSLGLTQSQMAQKVGTSLRAYQGHERDEGLPKVEALLAISELGADLNWVITGKTRGRSAWPDGEWEKAGGQLDQRTLGAVISVVLRSLNEEHIDLDAPALAELIAAVYCSVSEAIEAGPDNDPEVAVRLAAYNLENFLPLVTSLRGHTEEQKSSIVSIRVGGKKRKG